MTLIKRNYLFLDLGFYSACNMKCTYCRSEIVRDEKNFHIEDLERQVEAFQARFKAGVVKMSGYGEVTMWKDFPIALEYLSEKFPTVQIITNGTFTKRTADLILSFKNVSPNITIDGHTMEMNATRVQGATAWHERMLSNLHYFAANGRPVEVNCVLHERNVDGFEAFAQYLSAVPGAPPMLLPFPVKSFDRAPGVGSALRDGFDRLAENIETIATRYSSVMPPSEYIVDLKAFLRRGSRNEACHVHWANLGSGSRNERLHCPNYGEDLTYGAMIDGLTSRADAIAREEHAHLQKGHVGPGCAGCFNHFHVINQFLEGTLSIDKLQTLPSLRAPEVRALAMAMKSEFDQQYRPGQRILTTQAMPN